MKSLFAIVASVVLAGTAVAFDFPTQRGVALGGAVIVADASGGEMLAVPSPAPARGWQVESGFIRTYELHDLDQFTLVGAYESKRLGFAVGLSQFGRSGLYTEKLAKGSIALHLGSVSAAVMLSNMSLAFGGNYSGLSAFSLGFGIATQKGRLLAGAAAEDVNTPSFARSSAKLLPSWRLHGEVRASESYSLVGRALWKKDERPRFSLGQRLGLGGPGYLLMGVSTRPVQFGGGLELRYRGAAITYGASYHGTLGLTQSIAVGYGAGTK